MWNILLSVVVSVLSFGAVGDGQTDNTAAFQQAIDGCAEQGGGIVSVPEGCYLMGTLQMRSHIELRLDSGAVLRGTQDLQRYKPLTTMRDLSRYDTGLGSVNDNSAANPVWSQSLIQIVDCEDVAVTGHGIIDGADVRNPQGEEGMRGPHTLLMCNVRKVRIEGVSIRNAANYAILGYDVSKGRIRHIRIEGGWDGVHIRGCRNVRLEDSYLSTGDDAIAGGYWDGLTVRNCILNSSCNGIRMIEPSDCFTLEDTAIYGPGLHPHITSGKHSSDAAVSIEPGGWGPAPGKVGTVTLKRLTISHVLTPLSVTLAEGNDMERLVAMNINARATTRMALSVKSWGTARTHYVRLEDCRLEFQGIDDPLLPEKMAALPRSQWPFFPSYGLWFRNVDKLFVKNVECTTIGKDYRPVMMRE